MFGGDFYSRRTLSCLVGEEEDLWGALQPALEGQCTGEGAAAEAAGGGDGGGEGLEEEGKPGSKRARH